MMLRPARRSSTMRSDGWPSNVDTRRGRSHAHSAMRVLSLLIVAAAFLGLLGETTAFAMGSAFTPAPAQAAAMEMDCGEAMPAKPARQEPCKGLTFACIAAMGCTVPLAITPDIAILASARVTAPRHARSVHRALAGRDVAPEHDPPIA